jgi:hypothetical protein
MKPATTITGRVLDPADYTDGCDHCRPVTADPTYYVATPYQLEPSPRGGLVARYRHDCGQEWWAGWDIKD